MYIAGSTSPQSPDVFVAVTAFFGGPNASDGNWASAVSAVMENQGAASLHEGIGWANGWKGRGVA